MFILDNADFVPLSQIKFWRIRHAAEAKLQALQKDLLACLMISVKEFSNTGTVKAQNPVSCVFPGGHKFCTDHQFY